MKQNFTKADLENLMVVELRNGWKAVVIDDILMFVDGYMSLNDYRDHLKHSGKFVLNSSEYDIIKIWNSNPYMGCGFNDYIKYTTTNLSVFWERKEKKEIKLTTEERVFLNSILLVSDYKYIARDRSDELCLYKPKPERGKVQWGGNLLGYSYKRITDQTKGMFEFITWDDDEPYLIEDLLKGDIK